jgi:glycosyltransferase involved in cell wall biosynthesis
MEDAKRGPRPQRIAFVGGFEPRQCGIATFTHDLCEAVAAAGPDAECWAGAVNDTPEGYAYPPRVRFELQEKELGSYRRAADFLNFHNVDVVCLQHEFGIYGGPAGSHVLALVKELRMPVVVTLHTVLEHPDPDQRAVMEGLVRYASRLVVMASKGAQVLRDVYAVAEAQVEVIPHGIPDLPFQDSALSQAQFGVEGRRVLLTFGLLGPGKGIEYVLEALPAIVAAHPEVVYLVLGATHPHLVAHEGERYRLSLERLAEDRGVADHVIFFNRFVSPVDLAEFILATDIYVTPYVNPAQVTSGTLAYVFGAGKAVVSTPYWHAAELLADGRGTLVPFRDPGAIAAAVCAYLDDPRAMETVRHEAYRRGREMVWPAVAGRYLAVFDRAGAEGSAAPRTAFADWTVSGRPYELPPLRLDHLERMTDSTGLFQHAVFTVPNFAEGYCTDDNARAFLLCLLLKDSAAAPTSGTLGALATGYLAFLAAALNPATNQFRNFLSFDRRWTEDEGSEESHGRALWALGTGSSRSSDLGRRKLSTQLFHRALGAVEGFSSPRAWAFALLGVLGYLEARPGDANVSAAGLRLADRLGGLWDRCATAEWPWFEPRATYENARLCQALVEASSVWGRPRALAQGLEGLGWLASIQTTPGGHFRPIGSDGFYPRGGTRADFDQQPVEALAMVSASLSAFRATLDPRWTDEAQRSFEWFLGRNDLGLAPYDSSTGGCGDGLHPDRVNENQGAESTLAFHLARAELARAELAGVEL